MAAIDPGLRLHHVTAGTRPRVVVLPHGFPQTWRQWHRVIGPLVASGFRVVAPGYRGAGQSWRPHGGYDKRTMAETSTDCCASTSGSRSRSRWSATTSG
jgi:pimeloyl-ACP methyl ester carboxylesterase